MTPTTSVYHQPDPGPDGLCRVPGCGRPRVSHIAPDPAPAPRTCNHPSHAAYGEARRAVVAEARIARAELDRFIELAGDDATSLRDDILDAVAYDLAEVRRRQEAAEHGVDLHINRGCPALLDFPATDDHVYTESAWRASESGR